VKGDTLIAFIYSRGVLFWSKAYIITSEEADEVAIAIPIKRSTKARQILTHSFYLSILSDFDDSLSTLKIV
jgi:hypothetical protein